MSVKPLEDEGPLRDRLPPSVFRLLPTRGTNARIALFCAATLAHRAAATALTGTLWRTCRNCRQASCHARFRLTGECYA
jgi:hypothetical protein